MNALDLMRAPIWPSYALGPRPLTPPPSRPPASPADRYVPPPLCHAWGVGGAIHSVVQRDTTGICATVVAHRGGDRETFEIKAMPADAAREFAVRLIQQADAWDREFGGGVRP